MVQSFMRPGNIKYNTSSETCVASEHSFSLCRPLVGLCKALHYLRSWHRQTAGPIRKRSRSYPTNRRVLYYPTWVKQWLTIFCLSGLPSAVGNRTDLIPDHRSITVLLKDASLHSMCIVFKESENGFLLLKGRMEYRRCWETSWKSLYCSF